MFFGILTGGNCADVDFQADRLRVEGGLAAVDHRQQEQVALDVDIGHFQGEHRGAGDQVGAVVGGVGELADVNDLFTEGPQLVADFGWLLGEDADGVGGDQGNVVVVGDGVGFAHGSV